MKFIPHQYQSDAIQRMINSNVLALFMDPGCGKTVVTLSVLAELKQKTLIIAPLEIIYRVWPNEIKKWDHTSHLTYQILHGPDKIKNMLKDADIYLINPEGLTWFLKVVKEYRTWKFDILVVDESTIFKNHKSIRFAYNLVPMLKSFYRRYILSGTPVTKTYLDLWSQYFILDLGKRLETSWYKYRTRYFYQVDRQGYKWDLFPDFDVKVKNLVKDITIHVSATDHLDLPDIMYNDVLIDLNKSARESYKEMARNLLLEFDDGEIITAANAAVKTGKLQCISNGFLYLTKVNTQTGKNEIVGAKRLHDHKLDALESIIEELNGNPILVGYHYRQDLASLLERFPKTPFFGSGADMETKLRIEREWNAGNIPVLFAQIHSTARGLNLQQSGYHIAFYSLTWNFEDADQFVKRIARQGQKASHVFVHRLIGRNTIDELIIQTIDHRKDQSNDFLSSVKQHLQESV